MTLQILNQKKQMLIEKIKENPLMNNIFTFKSINGIIDKTNI